MLAQASEASRQLQVEVDGAITPTSQDSRDKLRYFLHGMGLGLACLCLLGAANAVLQASHDKSPSSSDGTFNLAFAPDRMHIERQGRTDVITNSLRGGAMPETQEGPFEQRHAEGPFDKQMQHRREFMGAISALAAGAPLAAGAEVDYFGVKDLGGNPLSIDLNNANIRAYLRMPGMYPTIAGKIVSIPADTPLTKVSDIYSIKTFTAKEKEVLKQYESRFVVNPPKGEFQIDRMNNGLYK